MKALRAVAMVVALGVVCVSPRLWARAPIGQYTVFSDAGVVVDNQSGLTWQRGFSDGGLMWSDAEAYCASLELGGHPTGWRLPTKFELETLVDPESLPSIDSTAFPGTPELYDNGWDADPRAYFWTGTPYAVPSFNCMWAAGFRDGQVSFFSHLPHGLPDGGAVHNLVRCVR